MTAPLDDVTVVEIASWMAAPSAAAILADLGANVIKVEPLNGDPMRNMSRPPKGIEDPSVLGYDFMFDVDNRGKHSVAVALDQPEGAEIVQRLAAAADVLLCNLLPQRQERFGLSKAQLFELNPKLVHATLTGYGTNGPDAARPGYDVTAFFGRSGLYDAQREGNDGVVPMARPAQGDHTTGLAFVAAILAALRLVERTGQGQAIETSLYETAVWTQATDFAVTAVDRAPVRRRARHEQLLPTANRFPCGDGHWIVLNNPEASAWPKLCRALDREAWLDDKRFVDPSSRYRNMGALVEVMDQVLLTRGRDEWGERFDGEGLIWGPVLGLDEVPADPQAQAIGLFPEIESAEAGRYPTVRIPMRFHDADVGPRGSSPKVGEHTRDILSGAGYDAAEIERLRATGVIA